jgi:hypothetical protein
MKTRILVLLGVGFALLARPEVSRAAIANGSFESWDLLGWNFQSDAGPRATEPFTRNAGVARTTSNWGDAFGINPGKSAATGFRFLAMNTRANANFLGNDTYSFSVSQNFSINAGEVLSGLASFYNGDSEPNDSAWVRILDSEGHTLATLWEAASGPSMTTLALAPTAPDWTAWQWAASGSGNYSLQLGMTTSGANNAASFSFFDGVAISAQPIPEPSTMALGILGGFAVILLRHRQP